MKASELQLADVVQLNFEGYSVATVIQIKDDWVTLFRPYVHTADFSCTSGVIPYIGFEHIKLHINDSCTYKLLERKTLR